MRNVQNRPLISSHLLRGSSPPPALTPALRASGSDLGRDEALLTAAGTCCPLALGGKSPDPPLGLLTLLHLGACSESSPWKGLPWSHFLKQPSHPGTQFPPLFFFLSLQSSCHYLTVYCFFIVSLPHQNECRLCFVPCRIARAKDNIQRHLKGTG